MSSIPRNQSAADAAPGLAPRVKDRMNGRHGHHKHHNNMGVGDTLPCPARAYQWLMTAGEDGRRDGQVEAFEDWFVPCAMPIGAILAAGRPAKPVGPVPLPTSFGNSFEALMEGQTSAADGVDRLGGRMSATMRRHWLAVD